MKSSTFVIAAFTALCFAACTTGDSPILKQARTMQEAMMKDCNGLDSTLGLQITTLEATLTDMSLDSNLNTDSAKFMSYKVIKEKYNGMLDAKTRMDNWRSNLTLIPTADEIAKGAENPFGKDAKDEDILIKIKSATADFATLKNNIQSILE